MSRPSVLSLLFALVLGAAMAGNPVRATAGNFTPLPETATVLAKIAFGSCADETLPQPIWQALGAARPDLFLFIGDNVYADNYKGEWLKEPSLEAITYAYGLLGKNADFNAFRKQVPMLVTWDDHDYGWNDGGADFPLKSESKQALMSFFEMPKDHPVRSHAGLYYAQTFGPPGKQVQVIMLDTRWFRSPLKVTDERGAKGKERYLPDPDPTKTLLGTAQWRWLEAELRKPADLRLLVSSIQLIPADHGWESWSRLPLEREKLFALLRDTGAWNTIVLSGDRHVGGFYRMPLEGAHTLVEFTSSSLNRSFIAEPDEQDQWQAGKLFGPENFGQIGIDWAGRKASLELADNKGNVVRSMQAGF